MPAEDHFISRGLLRVKINDYLTRELRRAGYSGVDLQKTPLGMRVVIYAARPGMVIGRRGATVRELTETLEKEFGLEAPQIEVTELEVPELNGAVMAERLAQRLERGDHFRRAAYGIIRRIVGAGSKGVEISIRGKLTSRRARFQKFRSGFVTKTGEPVRTNVSHGTAFAILKPGILGIQVWIMKPEQVTPDRPTIQKKELVPPAAPTPAAGELEIVEEEGPISEQEVPTLEDVREEVAPVTPEEKPASSEPQGKAPAGKLPVEEAPPAKVVEAPEKVKAKAKVKGKPKAEPKKPKAESSKAKAKPKAKSDKASTAKKAKPKAAKSGRDKAKATRKGSGG